jgi:diaminohydroxyphosphoribosylaminopyrimidine deaminase/5-amino-6-(5-phosphoribosylamino)uracil reductase
MVEGGATVHAAFLRAGLADRLVLYVGGALLGPAGHPLAAGAGPATLADADRWRIVGARLLGGDARLDCEPLPGADG